ncbi:hypothetical protein BCY86_03670 [Pajaroellobacter abortibovis]|uniref:Uncharacterized protein n=1 Tax=Pajaroellobacter abortibovis TaxID=1882918 RepID=A0A1L6MWR3_9BACT|nr:hypothetical protein BCY86_03670 [Pajaroellobacter abortibovis]
MIQKIGLITSLKSQSREIELADIYMDMGVGGIEAALIENMFYIPSNEFVTRDSTLKNMGEVIKSTAYDMAIL